MLDRHSRVVTTPETHFFDGVLADLPDEGSDHDRLVEHLLQHDRARDLDLDREELLRRFRAGPSSHRQLLVHALDLYRDQRGAERVVEKTPAHLPHVPRILRWFPTARIVLLVRDGRDAVMSMVDAAFTHDDLRRHCANWRRMARTGERLVRDHPDRVLQVRFEDLVRDPESTVRRVDRFLDLTFERRQLEPTPDSDAIPSWERAWKGRATLPVNPARVGSWRRRASEHQHWVMHAMMGRTLRWLGYHVADDLRAPATVRVREAVLGAAWGAALHPAVRPVTRRLWRLSR